MKRLTSAEVFALDYLKDAKETLDTVLDTPESLRNLVFIKTVADCSAKIAACIAEIESYGVEK